MASSQVAPAAVAQPSFAGLGRRLAAHLADVLIFSSVLILVAITMRLFHAAGLWTRDSHGLPPGPASPQELWMVLGVGAKLAMFPAFLVSLGPLYLALFESSAWQATFGKRLLSIYVTDDGGKRISIARAFGRWCSKWFLNWFLLGLISPITIAVTKDKKALHDYMAETVVVRGRPAASGPLEPWRIVAAFGIPYVWLLGTFLATL